MIAIRSSIGLDGKSYKGIGAKFAQYSACTVSRGLGQPAIRIGRSLSHKKKDGNRKIEEITQTVKNSKTKEPISIG